MLGVGEAALFDRGVGEAAPAGRREARGAGPLMSLVLTGEEEEAGCALARRVRSLGGETRAATLEDEPERAWAKEEGMGCAERWRVGDDMEAWRKEGVKKLVWPATRPLSLSFSLSRSRGARAPSWLARGGRGGRSAGEEGEGEGEETSRPGRRNGTLDSILDLALSFSLGPSSSAALALPLPAPSESTPDSSTLAGSFALDLVAVRKLCSRDERRRLNVRGCASAAAPAAGAGTRKPRGRAHRGRHRMGLGDRNVQFGDRGRHANGCVVIVVGE